MDAQEIKQIVETKVVGVVKPEHDSSGHHYRHIPNGERYDSVTGKFGILDAPHLKRWAAWEAVNLVKKNWDRIDNQNKEEYFDAAILAHQDRFRDAGNIGTQGHDVIDKYIKTWITKGEKPKEDITKFIIGEDVRLWPITQSAQKFLNDYEITPIASELYVASKRYRFGGTLDFLAMIKMTPKSKPRLALIDWKTSSTIDKPDYAIQISAYWQALWEMTGLCPNPLIVVKLSKNKAGYQAMKVVNRKQIFKATRHLGIVSEFLTDGVEKLTPLKPKKIIKI